MTMNEPQKNHRAPLIPGEIRTHTVGTRTYRVMHVVGGSFTQASYRDSDVRTVPAMRVLKTDRFEQVAVDAYADAIEQAESDRTDALDDADGTAFVGPASGRLIEPDASYNLPDGANPALVYDEGSTAAPTLADEVTALRVKIEQRSGVSITYVAPGEILQLLDRIAGMVPQRATAMGLPIWQHACGVVDHGGPERPHPDQCDSCRRFRPLTSDPWRPLYTLPDGV